jgi:hypothetical protein
MSTATERIMRERGDCRVFHEPFLAYHYLHRRADSMPMLDTDLAQPQDYPDIRQQLLDAAVQQPVFFKDMSYFAIDALVDDLAFCQRLCNVFLIRDPRRSIASYHKLDAGVSLTEIGLDAQWRHYQHLQDIGIQPLVLQAEVIADDPQREIGRLWRYAGLAPLPQAFNWRAEAAPSDWEYVRGWHADVIGSSGIRTDNRDAQTVFEQAASNAPHLREYLAHHQPFYEKLRQVAIEQGQ